MEKVGSERGKEKDLGNSQKDKSVFIRLKDTSFIADKRERCTGSGMVETGSYFLTSFW